jgi:NAD(P)-dependent dehydrogenase (short-subunit alcohol dehydrogenase family)
MYRTAGVPESRRCDPAIQQSSRERHAVTNAVPPAAGDSPVDRLLLRDAPVTEATACRRELIEAMTTAVAPGKQGLTPAEAALLREHTQHLLELCAEDGRRELQTFRDIRERSLTLDADLVARRLTGKVLVVTGGTGCIGSSLVAQLAAVRPARLVSISRGLKQPRTVVEGVEYVHLDIRDGSRLDETLTEIGPDVVFHLAAQHDPALAEVDVAGTLSTNISGTANVIDACRRIPGVRLVHASTGKALRPFSRDVYAASKKVAEHLLAQASVRHGLPVSAVRFTHVVDNSIIANRIEGWAARGEPFRLHSAETMFYLQSAVEAAQLLMCASLSTESGRFAIEAIRDLGWPISLLDLSIGWLAETRSASPIYVCGFEAGYERSPYPGLYDPAVSGERSPLYNALECHATGDAVGCEAVDSCRVPVQVDVVPDAAIDRVCAAAAADAPVGALRNLVDEVGWTLWAAALRATPTPTLRRHLRLLSGLPEARFWADDRTIRSLLERECDRRGGQGSLSADVQRVAS